MMASKAEQSVSRSLRTILASMPNGGDIQDTAEFQELLSGLEFFVPQVLAEIYLEWKYESLDGFYPLVARATREGEAEVYGLCIIISDQTTTPIHLRLQVSDRSDEVSWLECRLGEAGVHGMIRSPWHNRDKQIHALERRKDEIDWVYKVTFGERRS